MHSARILMYLLVGLCIASVVIWWTLLQEDRQGLLTVSFLNIGQGDAIFIESPTANQVLIDGGPANGGIVRRLGEIMPWYDHSIDVVIGTHPDADHIGGLPSVLDRFSVANIVQSSVIGTTPTWSQFEDAIRVAQKHGAHIVTALRGQVIDIGGGAYLEVLSPDRALPFEDTNTACVVTRLIYGKTAFMLSCDAPKLVENYLVELDASTPLGTGGTSLHVDVLKAGHHGSKNSSSPWFVGFLDPHHVVYSRGCDNKYGHPNPETIATMAKFGTPTSDTCTQGTVTFVSDGERVARNP